MVEGVSELMSELPVSITEPWPSPQLSESPLIGYSATAAAAKGPDQYPPQNAELRMARSKTADDRGGVRIGLWSRDCGFGT